MPFNLRGPTFVDGIDKKSHNFHMQDSRGRKNPLKESQLHGYDQEPKKNFQSAINPHKNEETTSSFIHKIMSKTSQTLRISDRLIYHLYGSQIPKSTKNTKRKHL